MTQEAMAQPSVIGVDIGGTKVAAGLVDAAGTILTQVRTPMVANGGSEAALDAVTSAIDSVSAQVSGASTMEKTIQAIGMCAPGPLDPKTGMVINPPNLPCWRNFALGSRVADLYRVPVKLD